MTAIRGVPEPGVYLAPTSEMPFDYAATCVMRDWRSRLVWPIAYPTYRAIQMATNLRAIDLITHLTDDRCRRIAILSEGQINTLVRWLGEMALLIEGGLRKDICFSGGPSELRVLAGRESAPSVGAAHPAIKSAPITAFSGLRRFARALTWTRSPDQLFQTVYSPHHVAISHNSLLIDVARGTRTPVAFRHAQTLFQLARARSKQGTRPESIEVAEIAGLFEALLRESYAVADAMMERMVALFRPAATAIVSRVASDLDSLAELPCLPRSIWAGSAGSYATRALILEVRRRGGHVTTFDHGGSASMVDEADILALRECAVADRVYMPTAACAARVAASGTLARDRNLNRSEIVGWKGDPSFRIRCRPRRAVRRARPRVYYPPTVFRGSRQHLPSYLPDVVYLDWQFRLVEAVHRMPVDLVCKPHPEGLLRGKPHPLAQIACVDYRPFEDVIGDADVFLYDFPQSTTFWQALCTDRPVILIDLGITRFNSWALNAVHRRCAVIQARWDEGNLPCIDAEALESALCDQGRADPSEFRAALCGASS